MRDLDEPERIKKAFTLGQDVSAASVSELDLLVQALHDEAQRLRDIRIKKLASQVAADAFFKKPV